MEQEIEKLKQRIKSYESDRFDDEFKYKDKKVYTIEVVKQAIDIEMEALKNGNYAKARECKSVYDSAYSNFPEENRLSWNNDVRKQIMQYIDERLADTHKEIVNKYTQECANLPADITNEQLKSKISEFTDLCIICNTESSNAEKGKATEILEGIFEERISKLDSELQEAKIHIELPENETKCEELQKQIEELEEEFGKAKIYSQAPVKINISTFNNISKHKSARITEQGAEMRDIMSMIERSDSSTEFHISRKTEYLEKKLAVLQQHKEIPGNEDRINAIESELEQMQDAWALKQFCRPRGITKEDIVKRNNYDIREKTEKIEELQGKLMRVSKYINSEEQRNYIETRIAKIQSEIELLQQDNESIIRNGTTKRIMGEHHKARLEQEKQAKTEQENTIASKTEETTKTELADTVNAEQEVEIAPIESIEQEINRDNDNVRQQVITRKTEKEYIEPQIEKYRPKEESIRDEVGDELNRAEQNINDTKSVDLWMNRFNGWYNVIDRMSQSIKAKFIKMKDDIVKSIKSITRDRIQSYEKEEHNDEQSER